MGTAQKPMPAKLFLAVMYLDDRMKDLSLARFAERFGLPDLQYGPLAVSDFTEYYTAEMGNGIKKVYLTFEKLIERRELSAVKIFTNALEQACAQGSKRIVNLDPGYLTNDKLVLASTKDYFHRVYLDSGIYAEVTVHFRKGKYRFFSWTYPDYKEQGVERLLEQARAKLVKELRDTLDQNAD
jgi:hypothetical protein